MTASTGKPKLDRLTLIIIGTFLTLFIMVNSQADTYEWQGYCLPKKLLTPESYMQPSSGDANYDSDEGYGPSLFFNNEYLAQKIDGYSKTFQPRKSELLAHIMVNLTTRDFINKPKFQKKIAFEVKETDLLIFNRGESKWKWPAFENVADGFQFWGTCYLDGETSYECRHTAKINGLNVIYSLPAINIAKYKEIDNLIKQHLDSWQCQ